jgi:hypothetical protein
MKRTTQLLLSASDGHRVRREFYELPQYLFRAAKRLYGPQWERDRLASRLKRERAVNRRLCAIRRSEREAAQQRGALRPVLMVAVGIHSRTSGRY